MSEQDRNKIDQLTTKLLNMAKDDADAAETVAGITLVAMVAKDLNRAADALETLASAAKYWQDGK